MLLVVREYGTTGPTVVLVHGGPGAGGYLAPLARELFGWFHVLEPLQRGSGAEPLTVARHVADLDALLDARCADEQPALVGHSWGAMLVLAYAAAHPGRARALVLIGCGTFDPAARRKLESTVEQRLGADLRRRIELLTGDGADRDQRLKQLGDLLLPVYSCDPLTVELPSTQCDARAHDETWQDMLRLQAQGVYPSAFAAVAAPVLMLHGALDPHPGRATEATLRPFLPQLEYREWQQCGHYPWLERQVRAEFIQALRDWLAARGTVPGR